MTPEEELERNQQALSLDNLKKLYINCGGGKSSNELPFLAKLRIKIAKKEEQLFPDYK